METQKLDNIKVFDNFFEEEDFSKVFELSKKRIMCSSGGRPVWPSTLYPFLPKIKEITSLKVVQPFPSYCYIRHNTLLPPGILHHDFNENDHVDGAPRKYTFILYIDVDAVGEEQHLIFPFYNTEKELVSNEFTDNCNAMYAENKYVLDDRSHEVETRLSQRKNEFFKVSPKNNRAALWRNDWTGWHQQDMSGGVGSRRTIIVFLTDD
jgi:hypothetical protein